MEQNESNQRSELHKYSSIIACFTLFISGGDLLSGKSSKFAAL